jgi:hypothetical protein
MRSTMCGWTCLVLCAGWTIAVSAQGGPTTIQAPEDSAITVTGCIAETKPAGGAAASTPEHALSDPQRFTLNKAEVVNTEPSDAAAAKNTPVANQTKKAPAATQYRLDGSDSMLAPHVNHRVRITGSLEAPPAAAAASRASGPMVKVDSVLLLESSCS